MKRKTTAQKERAVSLKGEKILSTAWSAFETKLAAVLEGLEEDEFLILCKKHVNEFIQFSAQGSFGIRAETISNHYRSASNQLSKSQISRLLQLGWQEPTNKPEDSTPEADPDGSPNFYLQCPLPLDFGGLTALTVRTLTEVMNVSHPAQLEYSAFDSDGSIPLPELGLKKRIYSEEPVHDLPQRLLETVKKLTGIFDLAYDEEHELGIRYGSASTFIRIIEEGRYVKFYAIMVINVEPSLPLLLRINQLNEEYSQLHLLVRNRSLMAVSNILAAPFLDIHIAYGLSDFCEKADELYGVLQAEFGDDYVDEEANVAKQHPSHVVH